jgi:Surface lipoprotein of Spirochaetales order
MMKKGIVLTTIVVAVMSSNLIAQKLPKFGADLGQKTVMGKEIRVPYTDMITYFGYVKPGSAPDEMKDGKKMYYVYVWVPAVAPEIGVRMISPVPDKMAPEKTDIVASDYTPNTSDRTNYFDTWISFERAVDVTSSSDIATKGKSSKWVSYGNNDDSGELHAQPSGNKYNSVLRIISETSNPTKSLVMGLYRIGFTTYKVGEVQGSFLAQIGAPVKLPGVKIAKTLEEISK